MITRRTMLTLPAAIRLAAAANQRGATLWDYFMQELERADERRRSALQRVRTVGEVAALGQRVRSFLLDAIGGLPDRTPLNARVTGVIKRPGYVIEKIVFESRPRYYVSANLYLPANASKPCPGVIESCGHYEEGKAALDYQRACASLAAKGIAALIFDPMGQGERLMYRDAAGRPQRGGATAEHIIAGKPSLLVGRPLAHYRIWDAMRALDYLEARPEVDKERLGMFGHSGGGMLTLLTAPLDERLRAVMSCCAVTSFYHKTKALLIADPEQNIPGIYPAGVDHPELISAVAPRAFLIGAVSQDFVPLDGTRRTYQEASSLFQLGGIADRCALAETPGEHVLNKQLREACYAWMQRHLLGETGDTHEPELPVESPETLRCTPTGNVMDLPGARGVFELNRECARQLASRRTGAPALERILHLPARPLREPGIELPLEVSGAMSPLIIVVSPRRDPELAQALAHGGTSVMQLDLRGWGETTPDMPEKKASFSWDDFFAFRAIELGRPLSGMRVNDLLTVVEEQRRQKKVYVIGLAQGAVIALHAAAISRDIAGVAAIGGIPSYQEIMEAPISKEPVSSFVPGALAHYDLPQLAASIHPRPCLISKERLDARRILDGLRLS
jgi:cephalosporin-C deacetylase-like acetyl esterase